jgi:hypothetical protein
MKSVVFPLRQWLDRVPIEDLVERRMASLVQVILLGFIAILLIAAVLNLLIAPEIPWQTILVRSAFIILLVGFPLLLLRRGYFRSSILIVIGLFFILETSSILSATLREIAETLLFFTLTKTGEGRFEFVFETHSGDVLMTSGTYLEKEKAIRGTMSSAPRGMESGILWSRMPKGECSYTTTCSRTRSVSGKSSPKRRGKPAAHGSKT